MKPEYSNPNHFIAHISDTHLIGEGDSLYASTVDPEKNLKQLFRKLTQSGNKPEAIIFTGDLADMGEPEAYQRLKAIVEPAAEQLGSKIIWVMGNHDNRELLRTELLGEPASSEPVNSVTDVNGLRIITLDTSVPGHHYGLIGDDQLDWLNDELKKDTAHGTILAMHHPPIPSVLDLAVCVELRNQKSLAKIVRNRNIKSIIAGHLHYSSFSMFAGIPVSVASATCYTQDLNVVKGGTRGRNGGQSFNFIHLYEDTMIHSVVPLVKHSTVGKFVSPEESKRLIQETGYTTF